MENLTLPILPRYRKSTRKRQNRLRLLRPERHKKNMDMTTTIATIIIGFTVSLTAGWLYGAFCAAVYNHIITAYNRIINRKGTH